MNVTPEEYRGTKTCTACGCRWQMFDLSEPNPIDELCYEPLFLRYRRHGGLLPRFGCDCHNPDWVDGYLDERARRREEVLLEI